MLKFYNSLGRRVQPFKPIKKNEVRMYTCGPTVWNFAHIGNYRTFVFEDILRRYLKFKGYKVTQVMNITDVEDRIIRGIKESGKSLPELTKFYENLFMQDLATLNVEKAEVYPRATENIPEMVALIKVLLRKKYAYKSDDGSVYFDISKFKDYGALSGIKQGALKSAGRVTQDHYEEKKEASDFALWKAWDREDGDVFWVTELGKGRPGWHIECSAMSMKYLGRSFDIHTGGLDNKFPHHENEIAQSEAATGKKFVNYWLHSGLVNMEGEEMHKSVGNVVYLRDLLKKGWDPQTIRLFLISARYRDKVNITDAGLEQARAERNRLQEFVARLKSYQPPKGKRGANQEDLESEFEEAMDDDLNTPRALGVLFGFAKKTNGAMDAGTFDKAARDRTLRVLQRIDSVLGALSFDEEELTPELKGLVEQRDEARKRRDFAESDRLRAELLKRGIAVEDTPTGTRWKRVRAG